ncbi:MAG: hypothetical protein NC124_17445 [Clostridium sp.]|nr:hypothetical protein [Clostridium sp.]
MLHFSFSTVFMALLTSNALAILIAFCFRHEKTMIYLGCQALTLLVALGIARLLIPFEFPFCTNINLPRPLSKLISNFLEPRVPFLTARLSLWNLFEIILGNCETHSVRLQS